MYNTVWGSNTKPKVDDLNVVGCADFLGGVL